MNTRRVGNRFYLKGIAIPLMIVEPDICFSDYRVKGFNIIISKNIINHDSNVSHYLDMFKDVGSYIDSLKTSYPNKSASFFLQMWEKERNDKEHYDWLKQHAW